MTPPVFPTGTFTPRPGAGSPLSMLAAQSATELRLALRHGEQVLLTVLIPIVLLVGLTLLSVVPLPEPRIATVTPGVLALAVMSTAFTGQAIATGFERRYGVLKRLGVSPLPRWGLMTAKTGAVLVTEILQVVLLAVTALVLGWSPHGNPATAVLLLVLGTAAFSGLGLLMAGTLKAEATLAAANLVFLLLLVGGGVIVPLDRFPDAVQGLLGLLPISALSDGLRQVLRDGAGVPWGDLGILAGWAVAGLGAAARWFRWE